MSNQQDTQLELTIGTEPTAIAPDALPQVAVSEVDPPVAERPHEWQKRTKELHSPQILRRKMTYSPQIGWSGVLRPSIREVGEAQTTAHRVSALRPM
jgi:hypothetical protein